MTELLNVNKNINLDNASSIFFARELEQIKPQSYDVEYAPLSCFKLIPTSRTTDRGADFVTYNQYDYTGRAVIIANYADDVPIVNLKGTQFTSKIVNCSAAYMMSDQDLYASRFANKPMETMLIQTANEAIQREINQLAFYGSSAMGVQGWLTNTSISKEPVAGADAAARLWANKTVKEMVQDVLDAIGYIKKDTKDIEIPDTVAITIDGYYKLQTGQYDTGSDTTGLEWLLRNVENLTIIAANELEGAFGGLSGFIVYKRSERKFWQEMPVTFEMLPPQPKNQVMQVICRARYGGVIVPYPQSQVFRTGI